MCLSHFNHKPECILFVFFVLDNHKVVNSCGGKMVHPSDCLFEIVPLQRGDPPSLSQVFFKPLPSFLVSSQSPDLNVVARLEIRHF